LLLSKNDDARADISPTATSPPSVDQYRITVATNATVEERYAADRLQHWLQLACSCSVSVAEVPSASEFPHQLAVGFGATKLLLSPNITITGGLGPEGFLLRGLESTFSAGITGDDGAPRGAIYGVYEYLEKLGFGFWDSNATTIPRLSTCFIPGLQKIEERQIPALTDWRHNNNANLELQRHAEFSIAARQNNNGGVEVYTSRDVLKIGGGIRWSSPPGFVHTSFTIVPPSELKSSHPEWFGSNQLCWTNESLVEFVIKRVKDYLQADPNATVISVSQNDGGGSGICHNAVEDAVVAEEGSAAGPLLRAVNAVADAIKDEHPAVVVETLAYEYTRKPPKLTRPRKNVVIRLSNIECDFFHPLADNTSTANNAFVTDLKAWHTISNRTWIWTYVTDFANWVQPWPDYFSMASNIEFYIQHGVTGVYQEGQYMSYGGDLQELKSWLGMKLMWDPSRSTTELILRFLHGYYGGVAAPFVMQHINIFVNSSQHFSMSESMGYTSAYLSPAACLAALENIQLAKQAVTAAPFGGTVSLEEALDRLAAVELGTMYVVLLRWDEMRAWASAQNLPWPVTDSKELALAAFGSQYRRSGMDHRVGFKADQPIPCDTPGTTCFVLDQKLQPATCGLACAMVPCGANHMCDDDCGLSEGCHGIVWFNQTVIRGPAPPPPPRPIPTGPPGRRSFSDCFGYDCGGGSVGASPNTSYGDRCFPAAGGSSGLGPFVCCDASIPEKWQSKAPCTLTPRTGALTKVPLQKSTFGCWWPISAGCPGVPKNSVCPLAQPFTYGDDDDGWFCCDTAVGPDSGGCAGSCCLTSGAVKGCQDRPNCYQNSSATVVTVTELSVDVAVTRDTCQQRSVSTLLQLAASTKMDQWNNNSGWSGRQAASDCCRWYGIQCTVSGAVSAINLYGNGLEGTLPDVFGPRLLPELQFLSVGYNNLSGTLPATLALSAKLQYLDTRNNFLTGSLPSPLPRSLRVIDLHFNQIGGYFLGVGGLTSLQQLDVVHNALSGTLPSSWGDPVALRSIALGYNRISGSIPAGIGQLNVSTLRDLDLGPNLLTHVDETFCPLLVNASAKHMRCGLGKLPLTCPVPQCVQNAPLQCGAVCHSEIAPANAGGIPNTTLGVVQRAQRASKRRRTVPPPPPPPPPSHLKWTAVSCGGAHTCGLLQTEAGANLRCWGSNTSGQLGSDHISSQRWAQVSASDGDHTCAIETAAPGRAGRLACFGLNDLGQATVPPAAAASSAWVSTGRYHTCALSASGGLSCWGRNSEGQTTVPELPQGERWLRVRAGGHFTCGTSSAGAVHCWGCRADAPPNSVDKHGCKFGRGQTLVPRARGPLNGSTLEAGAYSACALAAAGGADNIRCWGGVDAPPAGFAWAAVAPGRYAWCGLTKAGAIVCWGMRGLCIEKQPPSGTWRGLAGHCDLQQAAIPAHAAGSAWRTVASGGWHACALAESGELRCWGAADTNQTHVPRV
jgi:hypothetical protein